jgi:lipopolysaccharide transport system ATP-binding protein
LRMLSEMSDSDVVIRVEGLGKKYALHHEKSERYTALRDVVARQAKAAGRLLNPFTLAGQLRKAQRQAALERASSEEEFWALKDVSFEIRRGERVGIIGRNGAGKSTLLKILSRITEPTTGRVEIRGRVASLLEVGTGFHPELTGRENIYLNGAILGMTRREIRSKFDEIVDFAEVEKFLDTPVKRYSSGMYVRLAFAIAAHLDPEILIVDEVLAVGDAEFQKKCLGKMQSVSKGGRTVLFVSHNITTVQQLCTSGLMIDAGKVANAGGVEDVLADYMQSLDKLSSINIASREDREGDKRLTIESVTLHDENERLIERATCGNALRLRIHYRSNFAESEHRVDAAFNLRNESDVLLTCFGNVQSGQPKMALHPLGALECYWPRVNLRSGRYLATIYIAVDGITSDWLQSAFSLVIEDGDFFNTGKLVPRDQGDIVMDQLWASINS